MSERYVDQAPFDPEAEAEHLTPEQERFYTASQWQLMWWKFRRHKLAVAAGLFLLLLYASTLVTEWVAPYELQTRNRKAFTCSTRAASSAPSSTAPLSS